LSQKCQVVPDYEVDIFSLGLLVHLFLKTIQSIIFTPPYTVNLPVIWNSHAICKKILNHSSENKVTTTVSRDADFLKQNHIINVTYYNHFKNGKRAGEGFKTSSKKNKPGFGPNIYFLHNEHPPLAM
jgi:hypothetical protein